MKRIKDPEVILESLKSQLDIYNKLIAKWAGVRDHAIEQFNHFSDLAVQAEDAINALEGKPTLKKMLEAALIQQSQVPPAPFESPANGAPAITVQDAKRLPAPEPGFKWAVNDIGQDVLVPIATPDPQVSNTAVGAIILPAVTEDSQFEKDDEVL